MGGVEALLDGGGTRGEHSDEEEEEEEGGKRPSDEAWERVSQFYFLSRWVWDGESVVRSPPTTGFDWLLWGGSVCWVHAHLSRGPVTVRLDVQHALLTGREGPM